MIYRYDINFDENRNIDVRSINELIIIDGKK